MAVFGSVGSYLNEETGYSIDPDLDNRALMLYPMMVGSCFFNEHFHKIIVAAPGRASPR